MIWAGLKMVLALGAVIILLVLLVRLLKRLEGGNRAAGADTGVRILTSKLIAPQKYVYLVEIAGEVLALGVSPQQITFLTKIEDKEMVKKYVSDPALRPEVLPWLKAFSLMRMKGKEGTQR